jgi:hypothetical protein
MYGSSRMATTNSSSSHGKMKTRKELSSAPVKRWMCSPSSGRTSVAGSSASVMSCGYSLPRRLRPSDTA